MIDEAGVSSSRRIYLGQVRALTVANLKSRYRKTLAGFVWVILSPIIMYGAQSYAFSQVLKLDVPNYPLFLLSGLLPWIFLSQALEMCTAIFVNSGELLKAFPVHPLVFLGAQVSDNLINFVAAFALILVPVLFLQPVNPLGLLACLLAILVLFVGVVGMTWLLATVNVFFRDTKFVISFVVSVAFFLTPVFYPVDFVPARYAWLVDFNPLHRLIAPFRYSIYNFSASAFLEALGLAALVAFGFLGLAALYWKRKRNVVYLSI